MVAKMPVGRPEKKITDEIIAKSEEMAARGLTMDQIALCLGMGTRTLYEKKAKYPQLAQAIKAGQAKGIAEVTNNLYEQSKAGNVTATIFYLKNRDPDRWLDTRHIKVSDERAEDLTDDELAAYLPGGSRKGVNAAKGSKAKLH